MSSVKDASVARRRPRDPQSGASGEPRATFQMRIEPDLLERIRVAAESLGLTVSAFLRLAAIERMQRMEAEQRDASGS